VNVLRTRIGRVENDDSVRARGRELGTKPDQSIGRGEPIDATTIHHYLVYDSMR
jgi:hypothetical protein